MKRFPILFTLGLAALGCGLDSGGDSVAFGSAGAGGGQTDASAGGAAATGGGINTGGVAGTGGSGGVSGASGTGGLGTGGLGTGGLGTGGLGSGGLGTGGLGTGGVVTGGTGGVATGGTGGVATGGTGGVATGGTGGVATGGTGGVATGGTGGVATGGTGGIVGTGGVATGGMGGVATGGSGGTGGVTGLDCSKWPGSQAFQVQGQTHCYWLVTSGKNFDDARKDCSNNSGYLATIHSKAENDHVKSVAFGGTNLSAVWIGLSRDAIVAWCFGKANFKWTTGEPKPYQKWANNEPDCSGRRAAMDSGGSWRDRPSWHNNSYVCEAGPLFQ